MSESARRFTTHARPRAHDTLQAREDEPRPRAYDIFQARYFLIASAMNAVMSACIFFKSGSLVYIMWPASYSAT